MRRINPATIAVELDGTVPESIEEQATIVWSNMKTILSQANMEIADIVQLNMLLIDRADRDGAMRVRDAELGPHRPASTLMYISGLANPAWKIEIDFIAAKEEMG